MQFFAPHQRSGFIDVAVIAILVLVSAVVAVPVTYFANKTTTENRSYATISCGGGTCPDGWSYGADPAAPQTSCAQRAAEACAGHQAKPAATAAPPAATTKPGTCTATGCTYYSCTQKLNTDSCGGRTGPVAGFCATNYPASDPCKISSTPATAPPTSSTPPTPTTGTCPAGQSKACGGCLVNVCVSIATETCQSQINRLCNTNSTCAGNGVAPAAGQSCCSPYVLYSNGKCGTPTTASCIAVGGSKPVGGTTPCCTGSYDCGTSCAKSSADCPAQPPGTQTCNSPNICVGSGVCTSIDGGTKVIGLTCTTAGQICCYYPPVLSILPGTKCTNATGCSCAGVHYDTGTTCPLANPGGTCSVDSNCTTGICSFGRCQTPATPIVTPSPLPIAAGTSCSFSFGCLCAGGTTVSNGGVCPKSSTGAVCKFGSECVSGVCSPNGICSTKCTIGGVLVNPGMTGCASQGDTNEILCGDTSSTQRACGTGRSCQGTSCQINPTPKPIAAGVNCSFFYGCTCTNTGKLVGNGVTCASQLTLTSGATCPGVNTTCICPGNITINGGEKCQIPLTIAPGAKCSFLFGCKCSDTGKVITNGSSCAAQLNLAAGAPCPNGNTTCYCTNVSKTIVGGERCPVPAVCPAGKICTCTSATNSSSTQIISATSSLRSCSLVSDTITIKDPPTSCTINGSTVAIGATACESQGAAYETKCLDIGPQKIQCATGQVCFGSKCTQPAVTCSIGGQDVTVGTTTCSSQGALYESKCGSGGVVITTYCPLGQACLSGSCRPKPTPTASPTPAPKIIPDGSQCFGSITDPPCLCQPSGTLITSPSSCPAPSKEGTACSLPHGQFDSAVSMYCCTPGSGASGAYQKTACSSAQGYYAFGSDLPDGTWCSTGFLGGCTRCASRSTYSRGGKTYCGTATPYCSVTCLGNSYCKPDTNGGTCVRDIPTPKPTPNFNVDLAYTGPKSSITTGQACNDANGCLCTNQSSLAAPTAINKGDVCGGATLPAGSAVCSGQCVSGNSCSTVGEQTGIGVCTSGFVCCGTTLKAPDLTAAQRQCISRYNSTGLITQDGTCAQTLISQGITTQTQVNQTAGGQAVANVSLQSIALASTAGKQIVTLIADRANSVYLKSAAVEAAYARGDITLAERVALQSYVIGDTLLAGQLDVTNNSVQFAQQQCAKDPDPISCALHWTGALGNSVLLVNGFDDLVGGPLKSLSKSLTSTTTAEAAALSQLDTATPSNSGISDLTPCPVLGTSTDSDSVAYEGKKKGEVLGCSTGIVLAMDDENAAAAFKAAVKSQATNAPDDLYYYTEIFAQKGELLPTVVGDAKTEAINSILAPKNSVGAAWKDIFPELASGENPLFMDVTNLHRDPGLAQLGGDWRALDVTSPLLQVGGGGNNTVWFTTYEAAWTYQNAANKTTFFIQTPQGYQIIDPTQLLLPIK